MDSAKEIPRKNVETACWFCLATYNKVQMERNELKNVLFSFDFNNNLEGI